MKFIWKTDQLVPLALGLLWVAVFATGCGQDRRSTSTGRGTNFEPPPSGDATKLDTRNDGTRDIETNKNLTWNLPCQAETRPEEQTVDDAIVGGGVFRTSGAKSYGITFNGSHCDGANPHKDVLFLFDSSSAMSERDPLVNGSCARLDMASALMKSFAGVSKTRFALLAFSNGSPNSILSSGRFFETEQALMGGLEFALNNQSLAEALCDSADVGTNYSAGLTAAESLIKVSGATDAGAVVVFVTADRPLFGQTGEATAVRLRSTGTLITTLMVGGQDQVLHDRIASVDRNGSPLHVKIADTSELMDAVFDLTSRIVIPDVLRYRAVGTESWTVVNLYPLATSLSWTLPRLEFPASAWPNGVEVEHLHFLSDGTGKGITKGTLSFQP